MGVRRAIGLMSGTSLDGVDVALIETDGETVAAFGPTGYRPYAEAERRLLRRALVDAAALTDRSARPGVLAEAEAMVTEAHADAVERFLRDHRIAPGTVDVVGFHGQTVLHRPARRLTVQLGDGEALAARLGIAVVYDFRAADLAHGGQGAPLVPVFHRALAQRLARPRPLAILNVGGVANVTVIDGAEEPWACDTGPGNALLDDFMLARTGVACDPGGAAAAQGRVDEAFVAAVLSRPFFSKKCPKSLDRNEFVVDTSAYSTPDGAATLTALTAAAAARALDHLPEAPRTWIVAGGGARNPTLMRMLAERLAPARVETAAEVGWSIDFLEAQAFAFLAVRSQKGWPITFPGTTGAPRPLPGGRHARPPGQRAVV
ncbi:MAG: anhydro-N-acetylmuramic acid kinase [Variibacter sp.]|nr:anhydro-N-acetylmuramic acid kinase [Variibacter sp.]